MTKTPARVIKAYEYYYELGPERSLMRVSQKYGVTVAAVGRWSKKNKWVKRVNERDKKASEKALDSVDDLLIKAKKDNLKIIQAVKIMLAEKIRKIQSEGRIMDVTFSDFERLAKLELLMLGDPTERISDDTITGLVKDAEEYLKKSHDKRGD